MSFAIKKVGAVPDFVKTISKTIAEIHSLNKIVDALADCMKESNISDEAVADFLNEEFSKKEDMNDVLS